MHLSLASLIRPLIPVCAILFFSCKGPAARNDVKDTTHAAIDTPLSGRNGLIRALLELRTHLATFYDSISKELGIPGFGEALTKMDLKKLLHSDHLYDSIETRTEPCMQEFTIDITGGSVVEIAYGTNVNRHLCRKKEDKEGGGRRGWRRV